MATFVSRGDLQSLPLSDAPPSIALGSFPGRRRRIPPDVGRGLELLGHAIEYLADEHALECRSPRQTTAAKDPRVAAIEVLMERNRTLYYGCGVVPTLPERLRLWLGWQRA